jgi:hypothetical protein
MNGLGPTPAHRPWKHARSMTVHAAYRHGPRNASTSSYSRTRPYPRPPPQAGWPYAKISRALEILYEIVRYCALGPVTPQKPPSGRPPLLNNPLRQRLNSHDIVSHEQRLKPLREIAHELDIHHSCQQAIRAKLWPLAWIGLEYPLFFWCFGRIGLQAGVFGMELDLSLTA